MRGFVKLLHLNGFGRAGGFGAVIGGQILAPGHADHAGNVIVGPPHIHRPGGGDVKKRRRAACGRLLQNGLQLGHLLGKDRLGLGQLIQQKAVNLDPLHAGQGVGFIA